MALAGSYFKQTCIYIIISCTFACFPHHGIMLLTDYDCSWKIPSLSNRIKITNNAVAVLGKSVAGTYYNWK